MYDLIPDNPYILLTPGPLSTSKGVRSAMLRDWCTWDADYNNGVVQSIRRRIVEIATISQEKYTAILMQGSGSFGVEACLGTAIPTNGKLLILSNGAYGRRMVEMARVLKIDYMELASEETQQPSTVDLDHVLRENPDITYVAVVHCETTTGILNPIEKIGRIVKKYAKTYIVDAMSSFGGIPFDMEAIGIDYLISSANKCIEGVPGFSFVVARRSQIEQCGGNARSLCLDLYAQLAEMEGTGKWRYTSPTHVVRAFDQALCELAQEGGVDARYQRYCKNHRMLVAGMKAAGFETLLPPAVQSPIITSFLYPYPRFDFPAFYDELKQRGFVIYPGKVSDAETFRIGNIGHVFPKDIEALTDKVAEIMS